jgi:hypothetical protein
MRWPPGGTTGRRAGWRRLRDRIGEATEIREYITDDDILLYAVHGENLDLLSIKHHRQLSFDFLGGWS